jgi:hypothetical protein
MVADGDSGGDVFFSEFINNIADEDVVDNVPEVCTEGL